MDSVLCDELLQEIFRRLPPPSYPAVSLVSRRWLRLLRSSTESLSLLLSSPAFLLYIAPFLSSHPYLSSLSLSTTTSSASAVSDGFLRSVAFACPNLRHLRFLPDPVSLRSLLFLSASCPLLVSLAIALPRPLALNWLGGLHSLKDLSILITGNPTEFQSFQVSSPVDQQTELHLWSLSITGIRVGDYGLDWLWGNCKELRKLKLKSCEGVGDNSSFSAFIKNLKGLQEVELRTSRTIVDGVLLKLAENCVSLDSLLVYDGGSKQGLLQFIVHSKCQLKKLDLRLPLDLDDDHLIAMSDKLKALTSLRLQSCCLVTGEGIKTLIRSMSDVLEELALINCDAIERESGLLTTIGQNLRNLRVLDLSYNEMLVDKEIMSMLVSCCGLNQLKLRGCNKLTNAVTATLISSCKQLEKVDLVFCTRINAAGVESFLLNYRHLRQLNIEEGKLSIAAKRWALSNCIEIVVA